MRKVLLAISVFVLSAVLPISEVRAEPRVPLVKALNQVTLENSAFDAIYTALKANTVRSADTPEWRAALDISVRASSGSCLGQQAAAIVYSLIGWANRAVSGWDGVQRCDATLVMPGLFERSTRQLRWYLARARSGKPFKPAAVVTLNAALKPLRLVNQ